MKVGEVMTTKVVQVSEDDSVSRVRRILGEQRFHALPVVDAWGYLTGIITSSDFIGIQGDEARLPVKSVMQRRVFTIPETVELRLVARFMGEHRVRHLVIVRGGMVHGIISTFDLLSAMAVETTSSERSAKSQDPRAVLEQHGLRFVDSLSGSDDS